MEKASILPLELPQTDRPKKGQNVNCFQDILLELMNDRGLRDADVIRATKIPDSTWNGWITGEVASPRIDDNFKRVILFFNVHAEYLLFGLGTNDPVFKYFEKDKTA